METATDVVMPVIGVETEHLAVVADVGRMRDAQAEGARSVLLAANRFVFPNNDPATDYGVDPAYGYWGASDDTLPLPSGGGLYNDLEQPELNSAEALTPRAAYLSMLAGEYALAQALGLCTQPTLLWLMNRSPKPAGKGYVYRAGHINVQISRSDWEVLTHDAYASVLRAYLPFTLAASVLLGSGAVGDAEDEAAFLCCQRVEGAETIFPNHHTTIQRTLGLNLRGNDETLTLNKARTRNHAIGPHDSTVSHTHELRLAVVQGASYALLRAMPHRPYPDLTLQRPLAAAHILNRNPWATVALDDGRRLNAMDLVEAGVDAIDAFLAEDEYAAVALPDWAAYAAWLKRIVDALRRRDLAGSGVEWAAKKQAFADLSPEVAHDLDILWHQVEPALFADDGEHLARDCGHGPAFTEAQLRDALVTPPQETRAYLRAAVVQRCTESAEKVQMCDWDGLNLPARGKRISLPTPEDCSLAQLGPLESVSLDEILEGPAAEFCRTLTYNHRYRAQHHVRSSGNATALYPVWPHHAGAGFGERS